MCNDWVDLVQYIIQKFTKMMRTRPHVCAAYLLASRRDSKHFKTVDKHGFTKTQLEGLRWFYSENQDASDTVEAIIAIYKKTCSVTKPRSCVIKALLAHNIITYNQYKSLIGSLKSDCSPSEYYYEDSGFEENGNEYHRDRKATKETDEIKNLKSKLWAFMRNCTYLKPFS